MCMLEMEVQENKALVKRYAEEVWAGGNLAHMDEMK